MRSREIDHVNVVANTRTVRRRIIITKDLDVSAFPGRCLQGDRNDVALRIVIFAALFTRARGVEISQRRVPEPVALSRTSASRVQTRALFRRKDWLDLSAAVSKIGCASGSPYVAAVEEKTMRLTPHSRIASSNTNPATTLL